MKLKRKLLFTTSTLLVAATPVVAVISCGDSNRVNNNINDGINARAVVINASSDDLIVSGKDGSGTFKFDVSPSQKTLLSDAGATYEYFIKRYKDGTNAPFKPINKTPYTDLNKKPAINDLFVDDEIKVKVTLNKPGFIIKNGGVFQRKINSTKRNGLSINWYEPATTTVDADSMVKRTGDTIVVDLNKDIKTNELIFKMGQELGYLFSDDPKRYVAKLEDNTNNPITMKDICESLKRASKYGVKKITLKYNSKEDTLELDSMNNLTLNNVTNMSQLINEGYEKLKIYKDAPLDDSKKAPETVFTSNEIAIKFAGNYGPVAIPIKEQLLTLIGAMKDDKKALGFIPELAIGYGNIFQWMIKSGVFKEWADANHIRKNELSSIPNVFMATLFRTKPKN